MIDIGQILVNSLVTSSLYLLAGTGLTLTYGLSRFPNFAYAEFITVGAFCGLLFLAQPDGIFLFALVAGFLVAAVISASSYSLVFRPLVDRKTSLIHLMVAQGRCVMEGKGQELLADKSLRERFLGLGREV